ncbi:MAG: class I adenylate-forming enzyme family protein [bacterium]
MAIGRTIYKEIFKNKNLDFHKKAIITPDIEVTYCELNKIIQDLADALSIHGVVENDIICICFENSVDYLAHYISASLSNIRIIPIDVRLSKDNYHNIIKEFNPKIVACSKQLSAILVSVIQEAFPTSKLKTIEIPFWAQTHWIKNENYIYTPNEFLKEDFTIIFSSGSTGSAKKIIFSQDILINQVWNMINIFEINPADKILCTVVFAHSLGILDLSFTTLFVGATLYLENTTTLNPRKILNILSTEKITFYASLPFLCELFNSVNLKTKIDLSSLRYYICGGSPLDEAIIEKFKSKYDVYINQVYGLTEVGYITFNKNKTKINSMGNILPGIDFKIINDNGELCKANEPGELIVKDSYKERGMMVRGYYNNSSENAIMFRDGWMHTQDIVKMDEDGYVYFVSRKSEFLIIGGNKISPVEIEKIIAKHENVKEVSVTSISDGTQDFIIVAAVVPNNHVVEQRLIKEIIELCKKHIPYYMIPAQIKIFDSLPKTISGKIIRREVTHLFTDRNLIICKDGAPLTI